MSPLLPDSAALLSVDELRTLFADLVGELRVLPAETLVAPLPAGVRGGFGPNLRRFLLAEHVQGQVTRERLSAMLAVTCTGNFGPRIG